MARFRPQNAFDTPLTLLIPTSTTVLGVAKKTYTAPLVDPVFYGSFKTYGGTEKEVNGLISVEDTATVETWYRPDITSGCRISIAGTNAVYDILGEPENIEQRNQFLKFKVTRVKGGA